MPTSESDPGCNSKKMHFGNDVLTIVYNDSQQAVKFGTIKEKYLQEKIIDRVFVIIYLTLGPSQLLPEKLPLGLFSFLPLVRWFEQLLLIYLYIYLFDDWLIDFYFLFFCLGSRYWASFQYQLNSTTVASILYSHTKTKVINTILGCALNTSQTVVFQRF